MAENYLNDLILELGNAGGEKRIQISESRMSNGSGLITHEMIDLPGTDRLFGEGYAISMLRASYNSKEYATAQLTEKGQQLYEKLQSSDIQ
ncbi:hypothetical protein COV12_02890 [Candidatus Woesearchaeota archaeon CG10_big_fil_rev_8_21_14_0_10_32_24]|nr:MAG: hypothetical protein COV12_02890 [Candidatus Woesearchaeota archaeon CG10_big_fil_rev_8_21_14_0_10_32_24]